MLPADSIPVIADRYHQVRSTTLLLAAHLEAEDTVVQSMPDVSPSKWHLAHVTWFFERFILEPHLDNYARFDDDYHYLFNSYYYTAGQMHPRPQRGQLSRPTLESILDYRTHVDAAMLQLLQSRADDATIAQLTTLGLNHEQQHQELMLTDIKHVFSCNPLLPAVSSSLETPGGVSLPEYAYRNGEAGIHPIGAAGDGFCFDNETPRHDALLHEHRIGERLVTNGEFREFIADGGYGNSELWLSDGWAVINEHGWRRPLYWDEACETEFTLGGVREIVDSAPVCHVIYYEADRGGVIDLAHAAERELGFERLVPVKRPLPAPLVDDRPAVRQPQAGLPVRAVLDELTVLAVGHQPVADAVIVQQRVVPGRLVVETERAACGAHLPNAALARGVRIGRHRAAGRGRER